ncbi:histidine phosphatase superfamily [Chaetomium sp. MPI-SDFR-AT-0129]|nr:histidine phosphatase superfamily [Chaetomium sp. MPI-SDFR-AT-0129]
MPPTLILVRHAQGLHNVDKDYDIPDPVLTELGQQQCLELKANIMPRIPRDFDVGLILVSPMIRTIQTALLAFGDLIAQGVPIVADADWQENSTAPCDTGTPLPQLLTLFPQVNFSLVDPLFPDKSSTPLAAARYGHTRRAILARGQRALTGIRDRYAKYYGDDHGENGDQKEKKKKAIVVVSHSGFLRVGLTGRWYMNADYRVFELEGGGLNSEDEGDGVRLREWEGMDKGGLGKSREVVVPLGDDLPEEEGEEADVEVVDGL